MARQNPLFDELFEEPSLAQSQDYEREYTQVQRDRSFGWPRKLSLLVYLSEAIGAGFELATETFTTLVLTRAVFVFVLCALLSISDISKLAKNLHFLQYFQFVFFDWGKAIVCFVIAGFLFRSTVVAIAFASVGFGAGLIFLIAFARTWKRSEGRQD
jgi:hypothetical protein